MNFSTSSVSFTSHLEGAMIRCYNYQNSHPKLLLQIEQQLVSRCLGLLVSPASALELTFHALFLPGTLVYALGASLYRRKLDFILPWQHLQRVRDTVFPLLFGSLFSLIHPYFGIYAAEPARKHIATGILLSHTDKSTLDTVCSPITTLTEVLELDRTLKPGERLPAVGRKLVEQAVFWEGEFEKVQSIIFFHLKFAIAGGTALLKAIDESSLQPHLKALVKRISFLVHPLFVALDLLTIAFATTVCLGSLAVKLIGGHSAAYLEKAWTPEVLFYNLVKMPLVLIAGALAIPVGLVSPEKGMACHRYPIEGMAEMAFRIKMLGIKFFLHRMKSGGRMLLPAVKQNQDQSLSALLPSHGSHMRYILVEKREDGQFIAELIERGGSHRKSHASSQEQVYGILERTLALRYNFRRASASSGDFPQQSAVRLGDQGDFKNCVVTNLFASIQVLMADEEFPTYCTSMKSAAKRRYSMYAFDSYPFGDTREILREMDELDSHASI